MKNKKSKNLFISLGLIAIYASFTLLLFNGNNNELGAGFGRSVIYIITRNVALMLGALALILRLLKVIKNSTYLVYILMGTLNLCVGLMCIVLYIQKEVDMQWFNKCILNTFIGFLILIDVFFSNEVMPVDKK